VVEGFERLVCEVDGVAAVDEDVVCDTGTQKGDEGGPVAIGPGRGDQHPLGRVPVAGVEEPAVPGRESRRGHGRG